jgi:hypothetical protein
MPAPTPSWRSKFFASGGAFIVLASTAAALLDDNPATNPDWVLLGGVLVGFIAALYHPAPAK